MLQNVQQVAAGIKATGDYKRALEETARFFPQRPADQKHLDLELEDVAELVIEDTEIDDTLCVAALVHLKPCRSRLLLGIVNPDDKDTPEAFAAKLNLRAAMLGPNALHQVQLLVKTQRDHADVLANVAMFLEKRPGTLRVVVMAGSHGFHARVQDLIRRAELDKIVVDVYFGRDNLKGMTEQEARGWALLASPGEFTDHNRFVFFRGGAAGGNLGQLCPTFIARAPALVKEACDIYTVLFTGRTLNPSGQNMLSEKAGLDKAQFTEEFKALFDESTQRGDLTDYAQAVLGSRFEPALAGYKREILRSIANHWFEGPACDILIAVSASLGPEFVERVSGRWSHQGSFTTVVPDDDDDQKPFAHQFRLCSDDFSLVGQMVEELLLKSVL